MMGRRVGVVQRGKLLQIGLNLDVFTRPVNENVAEIAGVDTRFPGVVERIADGIATVRFNGDTQNVTGDFEPGAQVIVSIRSKRIE
jgi:ABC-type Fe3+/spermidine/putrescine transport system ATPase subunit